MSPTLLQAVVRVADARTPDPELLERFKRNRDERAFEELVRRHGPLVWAVCRQLLPHHADAEDAFQAVFLALVRGAGSIRAGEALPAWLHGVAVRVAMKARRSAVRRRQREERAAIREADRPVPDQSWTTLMKTVHEEIQRLPEAERTAFILCELEGVRQPDAAARLGWPLGTLSGRLCKARQRLVDQLTRRGIAPAVLVFGGLAGSAGTVPASLIEQVTSFPTASAAGVSSTVAGLARGLVEGTTMRTKMLAATILVAGAMSLSGGALVLSQADAQSGGGPPPGSPPSSGGLTPRSGEPGSPRARALPPGADPDGRDEGGGGSLFGPQSRGGRGGGMAASMGGSSWEYKFVDIPNDRREFERTLTQQGREGWEYAGSERGLPAQGRSELVLVFKKPRGGGLPFSGGGMGGAGMIGPGGGFGSIAGTELSGMGGNSIGGLAGMMGGMAPQFGPGARFSAGDIEARSLKLRASSAPEVARAIEKALPKAKTLKVVPETTSNMIIIVADTASMKEALRIVEEHESKGATGGGGSPRSPAGGGSGAGAGPSGGGSRSGPPGGGGGATRPAPGGPGAGIPLMAPRFPGGEGAGRGGAIHVVTLKHATAQELAPVLDRVFPTAEITAEPRSNQLIIRADDRTRTQIEELIIRLDVEGRRR
jgi:RNA polymerase sigma factor (sigma-70 family)